MCSSSPAIASATWSMPGLLPSCPRRWSCPRLRKTPARPQPFPRNRVPVTGAATSVPDPLRFAEIAPAFRDQVAKCGNDRMAFPYGGTALVLVFDRAAFDRAANRAAAEKESLALRPPRTWEQLDALARFFQGRDWDGDGAADHGIVLALGPDAEFLGDAIFLARAASLGQYRDQYSFLFNADTMAPRIDSPPFVAALEALVALKESGPPGMADFDAEAAPGLSWGESRALDRPCRDGRALEPWQGVDRRRPVARLGARLRPRAQAVGGERAGQRSELSAVRRRLACRHQPCGHGQATRCRDRLRQVPDQPRHRPADGCRPGLPDAPGPIHTAESGPPDPPRRAGRRCAAMVGRGQSDPVARRVIPGLRIPQAEGYLTDLSRKRVAALGAEHESAESALKEIAAAWARRTEELGRARQTWHYRRSLNALVTAPEPPER